MAGDLVLIVFEVELIVVGQLKHKEGDKLTPAVWMPLDMGGRWRWSGLHGYFMWWLLCRSVVHACVFVL